MTDDWLSSHLPEQYKIWIYVIFDSNLIYFTFHFKLIYCDIACKIKSPASFFIYLLIRLTTASDSALTSYLSTLNVTFSEIV